MAQRNSSLLVFALVCSARLGLGGSADPVGIILAAGGVAEYQRAGTSTWLDAKAGMLLAPGDSLRTASGTVRFAFCPDRSVQTLAANRTISLPAANLTPVSPRALTGREPVEACLLPAEAETDGTMARGGIANAAPTSQCGDQSVDLLEAANRAAKAIAAGDSKTAISLYRRISCYPGAVWTRGVISRAEEMERMGPPSSSKGETYALLIGISSYPRETPQGSLRYAHADARAFADLLENRKGGALPSDHVRLLTNEQATLAGIEEAVSTFVRDARKPENTLIILLAGHGDYLPTMIDPASGKVLEQAPFFLTYDTYAQEKKTTGLAMSRFRDILGAEALAFGRVLAYVDVCHAGHVEDASERQLPDAVQKVFVDNRGLLGLMLATSSRGVAFESDTFGGGHGAFTYAVLEGLNGAVAPNDRKQVTFDDLYNHVFNRVRFLTNNFQTPGQMDVPLHPVAMENATQQPSIELGAATPMPREVTGRRERGKPLPPAEPATISSASQSGFDPDLRADPLAAAAQLKGKPQISPASLAERSERVRVALEDRGQQIIIRYLRGEQDPPPKEDFELCGRYFEAALDFAPLNTFDESRMLFCQGRAAIFARTTQNYAAGTALLQRAIMLDPRRAYAYNALGIVYLEQARGNAANYHRAIDAFEDAIRFAPQWAYPLHNLALTYAELGDFLAASRAYRRAMELAPDYSYLPYNLGLLNQNVNRLAEAERYYRLALAAAERARRTGIEPAQAQWRERAVVWNALASVEMARHRYDQAAADLANANQDDRDLPARKHNEALLLSRSGPSPAAEQLWREVIATDAPAIVSRLALAEYLLRNGRVAESRIEYEYLLAVDAGNVDAHRQLAQFDLAEGNPARALPHLRFLSTRLPGDTALLELWGDTAARMDHTAEAISAYKATLAACRSRSDRKRIQSKLDTLAH